MKKIKNNDRLTMKQLGSRSINRVQMGMQCNAMRCSAAECSDGMERNGRAVFTP